MGELKSKRSQPAAKQRNISTESTWRHYVAHRNQDAFEEVLRVYHGLVYSVCRRGLGTDLTGVEDAVQETFCKLATHADTIHTNLASWLHSCAMNTVREMVRKERSRRERETKWAIENERHFSSKTHESDSDLDEAIASLNEADQMLVVEHFLVGRSQTELAGELGITPSGVNKRLMSVLEKLRHKLAQIGVTATISTLTSSLTTSQVEASTVITKIAANAMSSTALNSGQAANSVFRWLKPTSSLRLGGKLSPKSWMLVGSALVVLSSYLWVAPLLRSILPAPAVVAKGQLTVTGGHGGDSFGQTMVANADHLLVGAPSDNSSGIAAGAIYAFRRDGEQWSQVEKIPSPMGEGTVFGGAIAIDQNIAAIGGTSKFVGFETEKRVSSVQLYQFEAGRWDHRQTLRASDESFGNYFGAALAIRNDLLMIGAPYHDERAENSGAVYAYRKSGGEWTPIEKLAPPNHQSRACYGWSICLGENIAAIAAPGDDEDGKLAGAVYTYQLVDGRWEPRQKLTAPDGKSGRRFGEAMVIDGNTIAIGAADRAAKPKGTGCVYFFGNRDGKWIHTQTLIPEDGLPGAEFGRTVAINDGVVVVGAKRDSSAKTKSGAAYVFCLRWGVWTLSGILHPTSSHEFSSYADAAVIHQGEIFVGCPGEYGRRLTGYLNERIRRELQAGRVPTNLPEIRESPGQAFRYSVD